MIFTTTIRDALHSTLKAATLAAAPLFEKVINHSDADLGAALEHLRDYPSSIAVIVPGEDRLEHEFIPGTNTPVRTEIRNIFELLISARQLDMRQTGVSDSLTFKDTALACLLWDSLGNEDLICMPTLCEPMAIQFGDERNAKGCEAWKITLEIRQQIFG